MSQGVSDGNRWHVMIRILNLLDVVTAARKAMLSQAKHARRLSHTGELRKHHSSFFEGENPDLVKLPALRAITKSIK